MCLSTTDRQQRVLIVDADGATFELLEEWLAADGIEAIRNEQPGSGFDVALVDVSFPRDQGVALLRQVATDHPGTPILALSSGFFANVECSGPCAAGLGVAGVLPKPVRREALITAVRGLMPHADEGGR